IYSPNCFIRKKKLSLTNGFRKKNGSLFMQEDKAGVFRLMLRQAKACSPCRCFDGHVVSNSINGSFISRLPCSTKYSTGLLTDSTRWLPVATHLFFQAKPFRRYLMPMLSVLDCGSNLKKQRIMVFSSPNMILPATCSSCYKNRPSRILRNLFTSTIS